MDRAATHKETASKWGRVRLRPGIVAAALVLVVGTCALGLLFRHSASTARRKAKAEPKVQAVLHLEPFVVNLADREDDRFLRVGIDLGLDRELDERSHPGQSAMSLARTRDTILTILSACDAQSLMAPEGKANLKNELTKALRQNAPELGVREVYFNEFLVQR